MMYGLAGKQGFQTGAQKATEDAGLAFAGDFLSFGGIVFSSAAGYAVRRCWTNRAHPLQLGAGRSGLQLSTAR